MGTITRRTDNAGKATYQVKIRRKGYPSLSQTFAEKLAAETWLSRRSARSLISTSAATPLRPRTRPKAH